MEFLENKDSGGAVGGTGEIVTHLREAEKSNINESIYEIRGKQVMIDRDLAQLYGVETKQLNRAVKRNIERFPDDFMFQLTLDECSRCQIGTLNIKQGQNIKYLPYAFVAELVRKAERRIVLIDNYIDDTVLTMLSKRADGVEATIYTGKISKQLQLDIDKHNAQYPPITVRAFSKAHDRFLIIDDTVYLIGASIKDLGKKWFGFTLLENTDAEDLLGRM